MSKSKVYVIGVGPGGLESLTADTRRRIMRADIICGGQRLLDLFPRAVGEKVRIGGNLLEITDILKRNKDDKNMVVLASGDPGIYGIASCLIQTLGKSSVKILPNVSAMQTAFARIGESWDDAVLISVHARPIASIINRIRNSDKVCIFTDAINTPGQIARELMDNGLKEYRAYVCENLGNRDEHITKSSLKNLCAKEFSPLNTLILLRKKIKEDLPAYTLGIPDDNFSRRPSQAGLITKQEVRAVSLAKMQITPDSIIWDIGAGSGAVAIEASRLAVNGRVYAVEKNEADIAVITKNIQKYQAFNVEVIHAYAPEGLEKLPCPSAVFIGGSGGNLEAIISCTARKIQSGGRCVLNLVGLENLTIASESLDRNGFKADITLVSIARGASIREMTRLAALNPVFVVSAVKQDETVKHE